MGDDFFISVEDVQFRRKFQEFLELSGKSIAVALKEQARLLAQRLMSLTYPKSKAQGSKRVAIDIGKVYLQNTWFEETFQFRNQKLGERIANLVRSKNEADLFAIFLNSPRLNRIHIEPFSPNKHKAARKNGRVNYPSPFSFPLSQQGKVKQYVAAEKKNVGLAKAGWGKCFALLDGSPPAWLNRDVGTVRDQSDEPENPSITLTNKVSYFAAIDAKGNIVSRALTGRGDSMVKAIKRELARAAKEAQLE